MNIQATAGKLHGPHTQTGLELGGVLIGKEKELSGRRRGDEKGQGG